MPITKFYDYAGAGREAGSFYRRYYGNIIQDGRISICWDRLLACLLACAWLACLLQKTKNRGKHLEKKKGRVLFFFFVARRLGRYRQSVKVGGGRRDVAFENSNSEKTRITGKLEMDLSDP